MSTFQAVLYGLIHGFSEFLPISSTAHMSLISELFGWPKPPEQLQGYLALSGLLSVFLYFRHDWASIISSLLQVIIYRKKPMTLDERMPFFLILATLPVVGAWSYLRENMPEQLSDPLWLAGSVAVFAILLSASEFWGRKNKGMFNWNWIDALLVGIFQILALVPGCGRMTGALSCGLLRNYNREAIAKFSFFASAPLLGASAWLHLKGFAGHTPIAGDSSWLTISALVAVTTLTGCLSIGYLMKFVQRKSLSQFGIYRILLAAALGAVMWARANGTLG